MAGEAPVAEATSLRDNLLVRENGVIDAEYKVGLLEVQLGEEVSTVVSLAVIGITVTST